MHKKTKKKAMMTRGYLQISLQHWLNLSKSINQSILPPFPQKTSGNLRLSDVFRWKHKLINPLYSPKSSEIDLKTSHQIKPICRK